MRTTLTTFVFDKIVDASTIMSGHTDLELEIRRRSARCRKGMRFAKLGIAKRT